MSHNQTSIWLDARQSVCILPFSKSVATSSAWLNGPGGVAGDGVPMPVAGLLRGLTVFDGYTVRAENGEVAFEAGDRLAVYATYDGGSGLFSLAVVLNATPTSIVVGSVASSTSLFATLDMLLMEDA
ncbi:hypothetical protein KQI63_03980 [bacterium]|nr:hypothetical protein [bacterium]